MKKMIALILCAVFFLSAVPPIPAEAAEYTGTRQQVEYLPDGSCFITLITDQYGEISPMSTTVTRSKTATHYGKSGTKNWSIKVTGTFTYNGKTAKCIKSTVNTQIFDTSWKISSKSSSYSGNKAIANAVVKEYLKNRVVQTINKTVTLTCSPTGVFS